MAYSQAELAHWGVKGMKWGVRREAKRNYNRFMDAGEARGAARVWEISESDYKKLSSKPISMGSEFYRISDRGNSAINGFVYVTNNEADRNRYRAFFPPRNDPRLMNKKDELKINTSKKVRVAGEKVRVDTYIKTLDKALKTDRDTQDAFGGPEAARALNSREVGLRTYRQFVNNAVMRTKLHDAYFKDLSKKGYDATIDEADRDLFGKTPMILFPGAKARVVEIKPLSRDDVDEARLKLKPIA